jgi:hypothetical protein
MTKKKNKEEKKEEVVEVVTIESVDNDFYLTKDERLELLYLDAVIKNLELSYRLKEREFNEAIVVLQSRITELQNRKTLDLSGLVEERKTKNRELNALKETIEAKYSFKLSECSFDEFTGRITIIPQ